MIGRGRDGTYVITPEDVVVIFPGLLSITLVPAEGMGRPARIDPLALMTLPAGEVLRRTMALKMVMDANEVNIESDINALIRVLFERRGLLHLTVLHPMYATLSVTFDPSGVYATGHLSQHSLLVYRRMCTSVRDLPKRLAASSPPDARAHEAVAALVRVAAATLTFLAVLHNARYLHLDVKPDNVLLQSDATPRLADYGLVASMDLVYHRVVTLRGEFFQGTSGYVSPLLVRDDAENQVYPKFAAAAQDALARGKLTDAEAAAAAVAHPSEQAWAAYFARQRARVGAQEPRTLAKADLHSTGIMLQEMAHETAHLTPPDNPLERELEPVRDVVCALLFHGPRDVHTAVDALVFLTSRWPELKRDADVRQALAM